MVSRRQKIVLEILAYFRVVLPIVVYTDEAWKRFGELLAAERGGRSRAMVSHDSQVSVRTIQAYEDGKRFDRVPGKLWDLLRYYGWRPDSLDSVLAGGLPIYMPPAPAPAISAEEHAHVIEVITSHPTLSERRKKRALKMVAAWVESANRPPAATATKRR